MIKDHLSISISILGQYVCTAFTIDLVSKDEEKQVGRLLKDINLIVSNYCLHNWKEITS
jgi:hypothetical protein